jgi:hypothetical protein
MRSCRPCLKRQAPERAGGTKRVAVCAARAAAAAAAAHVRAAGPLSGAGADRSRGRAGYPPRMRAGGHPGRQTRVRSESGPAQGKEMMPGMSSFSLALSKVPLRGCVPPTTRHHRKSPPQIRRTHHHHKYRRHITTTHTDDTSPPQIQTTHHHHTYRSIHHYTTTNTQPQIQTPPTHHHHKYRRANTHPTLPEPPTPGPDSWLHPTPNPSRGPYHDQEQCYPLLYPLLPPIPSLLPPLKSLPWSRAGPARPMVKNQLGCPAALHPCRFYHSFHSPLAGAATRVEASHSTKPTRALPHDPSQLPHHLMSRNRSQHDNRVRRGGVCLTIYCCERERLDVVQCRRSMLRIQASRSSNSG